MAAGLTAAPGEVADAVRPAHLGSGFCGPSSMLAAISSAMVTSATSTSSLLAADRSIAVTRCQFEDSRRLAFSRLNRKVRTSASVTRLVPLRNVTGRANGRDQPMRDLLTSAGGGVECSMTAVWGWWARNVDHPRGHQCHGGRGRSTTFVLNGGT